MAERVAVAVDIGGTKLAVARVSEVGELLATAATPTSVEGLDETVVGDPGEALWRRLAELVGEVAAGDEVVCGVGCGGPMRARGTHVSPLNIGAWRDFPLQARLAGLLGVPVAVDNDAKALALGEGWRGAAAGVDDYLAMVVSTGVGGGVVLNGRMLDGHSGNAGHIGHVIVEPDGRLCRCGARGCLEAEASGTAIAAMTGRAPQEAPEELRRRSGQLVGRAIGSVVNLLDLRLAVVAGSVALGFGRPFFAEAQRELERVAQLEFARGAAVVPAGLGGDGPLVGAAAVGWRALADGSGVPWR